ncbi:SAF domain-containing protein [Fodinisporobacter ferrooxydans]|uniref:SAF domain-containing protein n=1 Tax=Fodinisporobacter ferrooxydans TaxID=2901836 RepID=A0ABY4CJC9_9BACL|nr:SAF domain-containing protein [Alicyclobacillaceae bacterium MYW30-H2]
MSIYRLLQLREKEGQSIGVAVIGAGQMGFGMISQISRVPGMQVRGVADINKQAAENAVDFYLSQLEQKHPVAVSDDFRQVIQQDSVDVVVDATGVPEVGAKVALQALLARKHLVLLNVEVDVTIGSILAKMFTSANLVYTGSAGDEPAATLELFEFAKTMGLDVVVAGKGKNNPFIPTANPDTCAEEAKRKHMSSHMLAAFQDGTKTMAEMNLLSNATGFIPDKVGMHGVSADVKTVGDKLKLTSEGGVLDKYGVVEYVHGLAPGVFVIVHSPLKPVDDELRYLSVGKGPYYTLYRPYHLASLETPISVARAILLNDPTIAPIGGPISETVAVAKRNINAGERVDGIGGYSVRGVIETHNDTIANGHIPIGLIAGHAVAKRNIPEGRFLTTDDIELDSTTTVWHLRKLQDGLF